MTTLNTQAREREREREREKERKREMFPTMIDYFKNNNILAVLPLHKKVAEKSEFYKQHKGKYNSEWHRQQIFT